MPPFIQTKGLIKTPTTFSFETECLRSVSFGKKGDKTYAINQNTAYSRLHTHTLRGSFFNAAFNNWV